MVGENLGKGYVFIFVLIGSKCRSWTWHPLFITFEAGLGNPFVSHSIYYKVIPCVVFESMLPNHWSCHSYVQELSVWNLYLSRPSTVVNSNYVDLPCVCFNLYSYSVSPSKYVTYFMSLMGDTSRPSCDKPFFLSTSARYPGKRLRNYLVP